MLLSRACEYGLQALLYIAAVPQGKYVLTREVASQCGLSYHFLGKILHDLVKNRLLTSQKGPSGGFTLAKPADEITLLDVINAIEGRDFLSACVLGLSYCGEPNPCPVHSQWVETKEKIHQMFAGRTITQLLEVTRSEEDSVSA
jgi:Rrf2 family protein